MKMLRPRAAELIACAIALLAYGAASAQSGPTVEWWTIAGGGGPAGGGDVTINDTVGQPLIGPSTGTGLVLEAGYWAACVAGAAATPAVAVAVQDEDVVLNWPADPNAAQYQVWVALTPYFDPAGQPPVQWSAPPYLHGGAAADDEAHYYVVRGLNLCGEPSGNSARKGEFTYGLVSGVGLAAPHAVDPGESERPAAAD